MITFPKIMETMNEKKQFFTNTFLDKAKEMMRRLAFTPTARTGKLITQKRLDYDVNLNKKASVDKEK